MKKIYVAAAKRSAIGSVGGTLSTQAGRAENMSLAPYLLPGLGPGTALVLKGV